MSFSGRIAIAGIHEYESRWAPDKTPFQITAECAREALTDAGLELSDVDGLFGATMTMGAMGIVQLAEYLNLKPRYLDGSNIGGSSFLSHVAHAAAAIHSGLCEVALILYGSTAASDAMAIGTGDSSPRDASAAFLTPYGMPLVGSYALVAQRHMHEYGTRSEQLADIAVSTRHHASLNPHAKMRQPITRADVLESRMIADPLHLLDCCIISDGGGAVVVTSLERARHRRIGLSPRDRGPGPDDDRRPAVRRARLRDGGTLALRDRRRHDLRLVHDHRARDPRMPGVLQARRRRRLRRGRRHRPRRTPAGQSGRRRTVIEAVRQLRGGLGDRQVEGASLALAHGTGGYLGWMHSGATLILGKD